MTIIIKFCKIKVVKFILLKHLLSQFYFERTDSCKLIPVSLTFQIKSI